MTLIDLKNIFYIGAIILFIICIILKINYSKLRGYYGEYWVKKELKKLNKEDYKIINNLMVERDGKTVQIDHIILSKYGIFVIETKNYYGLIIGNKYKEKWIQYLGKNKYFFHNPIYQNFGHIKCLSQKYGIEQNKFISIICFSNQTKLKISNIEKEVIKLDYLIKTVKSYDKILLDDNIEFLFQNILNDNINDKKIRKEHIKKINNNITNKKNLSNKMICPKCGKNLLKRNGNYGSFIGCENYPKCNYTKNMND